MRNLALSLSVAACLALGCASASKTTPPPTQASGGSGGPASIATGGSGGSGGTAPASTGGAGGTTTPVPADAATSDTPPIATPSDSGTAPAGDGPSVPIVLDDPSTWPGGAYAKSFIIDCPDGAPRAACCAHYCACMMKNCSAQTPQQCMDTCISPAGVAKWDMKCRVYNCFESLNPLATKDHTAHCEHAGVFAGSNRTRGAGDTHAKCHKPGDPDEP